MVGWRVWIRMVGWRVSVTWSLRDFERLSRGRPGIKSQRTTEHELVKKDIPSSFPASLPVARTVAGEDENGAAHGVDLTE